MTPDNLDGTQEKNPPLNPEGAISADLALALETVVDPAPILAVNAVLVLVPHNANHTLVGPNNGKTIANLDLDLDHHTANSVLTPRCQNGAPAPDPADPPLGVTLFPFTPIVLWCTFPPTKSENWPHNSSPSPSIHPPY